MTSSKTAAAQVSEMVWVTNQLVKKIEHQLHLHGISFSEYTALQHLSSAPNSTSRRVELAENIGLTASGITRMLLPMEKIGLVERQANPRDARESLVRLTSAGKRTFQEARLSVEQGADASLSMLSEQERHTLGAIVEKLSR